MLKFIAQNKYKLMVFIIGLYLLTDVLQHKGQTRVLFPKDFATVKREVLIPHSKSLFVNKDKNWKKGVNTKQQLEKLDADDAGFECDVYFDNASKLFDVHHDADKSTGYSLSDLLALYQQKKMQASIWLDIKNMNDSNALSILHSVIELRNEYKLQNKLLIESDRSYLLNQFSDSGFFTSYYIPFFNPYKINDLQTQFWADSIAAVISRSKINALSGYYFQCSFLKQYFPQYPVLTWVDNASFSLVNLFFEKKMVADKSLFIVLKP